MSKRLVLSLDGGGVKGAFQAVILDHLRAHNIMFDLIVGVSAGALNGIAYSQNTIKNTEIFTLTNSQKVCNKSLFDRVCSKIQPCPIYDGKGKRDVIENGTTIKVFGELPTKIAVITYEVNSRYPKIFKSWEDVSVKIVDICLATSASPVYYPAHKIADKWYIDGGIAMNNPTFLALGLAKELFGNDDVYILSIGCGDCPDIDLSKKDINNWGSIQWITGGLFELFTNSPSQYTDEVCQILLKEKYLRIEDDNVGEVECDDTREASFERIIGCAQKMWEQYNRQILIFLEKRPQESPEESKRSP